MLLHDTDHGDNPLDVCMYTPLEIIIPEVVTEALEWGLKCSRGPAVDPLALGAFLRDLDLDLIEVL